MADVVQAWMDHLKITGSVEEKKAVQWETALWRK